MSPARTHSWQARVAALGLGVLVALLLFEVACQAYARLRIFPGWDATMANERHFYRHSRSPGLAYELEPNSSVDHGGRTLHINAHGIRETSDELFPDQRRVAILGDSVVFGFSHDQSTMLSARVQQLLDPEAQRIKVFNFGLGGLNLAELVEFFRLHDATYSIDEVVLLINPNDFAPRDSVYEGADNGLYRMYERPVWMTRWFLRKAIYRYNKRGAVSLNWYEWMFAGNEQWGYDQLRRLVAYCDERKIELSVVLLPSAYAFAPDGYALEHIHRPIRQFLASLGVPLADPVERFRSGAEHFYDKTDHFQDEGNQEMARVMAELIAAPRPERGR